MLTLKTRVADAVVLTEKRIKEGKAEEPIKELNVLVDHYIKTKQIDKANAATRHLMNLSDGKTESQFEVLASDAELLEGWHKHRKWKQHRLANRIAIPILILELIALAVIVWGCVDPHSLLDLNCSLPSPHQVRSLLNRTEEALEMGNIAGAQRDIARALSLEPANNSALFFQVKIHLVQGELNKAISVTQTIDTTTPQYWNARQLISQERGDMGACASECESGALVSDDPSAWYEGASYWWGMVHNFERSRQAAIKQFDTARSDAERRSALLAQAHASLNLGQPEAAEKFVESALSLGGKPVYALFLKAAILHAEGRDSGALAAANQSIAIDASYRNQRAFRIRAQVLRGLGKSAEAQRDEDKIRRSQEFLLDD